MRKWTTALAVLFVLIAPVPALAGLVASGLAVVHALPWVLRTA
jgi:hypothetical protein